MKLNRLRNLALYLMLGSFAVMYLGLFWKPVLPVFFGLGFVILAASILIYFRVGVLSMRIPQVTCPDCGRTTKVLGDEDGCMYCSAPLYKNREGHWLKRN
jgi:hypothetical protein